uniref:Uncharacterized protein n=1 Tax=Siphoviridae sp. ctVif31 TaxID=2825532 RepID=A0A8S5Q4Q0_9CAUD|nr:MAG TPA: hypothetical protein [Siphoviridae sp. ctVif31]
MTTIIKRLKKTNTALYKHIAIYSYSPNCYIARSTAADHREARTSYAHKRTKCTNLHGTQIKHSCT